MALQVKASPMWPDAHGRYGVVRPICERGTLPSSGRFRFWNFGQAMLQEWPNDASSHPPWFPPRMQTLALGAEALALRAPRKWGRKRRFKNVVPINSVTLVGFVGSDPEQRQAKGNGSKFAVLSVATQRSWKNPMTSGALKQTGTGWLCSGHAWLSMSQRRSRKALTGDYRKLRPI